MDQPNLYLVVTRSDPDPTDPTKDTTGWRAASAVSPNRPAVDRQRAMLERRTHASDPTATTTHRIARVILD
jgi:hypothetical protein